MSRNPTDERNAHLARVARLLDFTGTPDGLRRLIGAAGFVPAEEAPPRTITGSQYHELVDILVANYPRVGPQELVSSLLAFAGVRVERPKTPEEKIADFARTLARYLPSDHATLTRGQLADLVREKLGVEL